MYVQMVCMATTTGTPVSPEHPSSHPTAHATVDGQPDGRRERGAASRERILAATTTLIAASGPSVLTHRAAAEAAGVPVARVSYHFHTVDDLLEAAAVRYLRDFDRRLRTRATEAISGGVSLVEACTDFLHELISDPGAFLAMVEVRITLARRGRTVAGTDVVRIVEAFGLDTARAASIVASLMGFAVLAATEPEPVERSDVRDHVAAVLGGMT